MVFHYGYHHRGSLFGPSLFATWAAWEAQTNEYSYILQKTNRTTGDRNLARAIVSHLAVQYRLNSVPKASVNSVVGASILFNKCIGFNTTEAYPQGQTKYNIRLQQLQRMSQIISLNIYLQQIHEMLRWNSTSSNKRPQSDRLQLQPVLHMCFTISWNCRMRSTLWYRSSVPLKVWRVHVWLHCVCCVTGS